jgi:hypothetical protein
MFSAHIILCLIRTYLKIERARNQCSTGYHISFPWPSVYIAPKPSSSTVFDVVGLGSVQSLTSLRLRPGFCFLEIRALGVVSDMLEK